MGQNTRRRVLQSLGVFGIMSLAGCFTAIDGQPTPTGEPVLSDRTETTLGTDDPSRHSPTTTGPGMDPDATPTPTQTSVCALPDATRARLLSFDDSAHLQDMVDGTLRIAPGVRDLKGTITNPYLFELQNGEVTLEPPTDEWEIEPVTGTTFDVLGSQATQNAEWEVEVPPLSTASEEYTLPVEVTYEACDGDETAAVGFSQEVVVTEFGFPSWLDLASAPAYYESLSAEQDPPGELSLDPVEVTQDLSDWADARDFQLKFSDYWPSDEWGALVERTVIEADGEVVHTVEAGTDAELDYIGEDIGSQRWEDDEDPDRTGRVADEHAYWSYQFSVPENTEELTATITVANGFQIEGREGVKR